MPFLRARDILKVKGIKEFRGTGDIDDWFEKFDSLCKRLMKDQALTTLKSCSGKLLLEYRQALLRRFREPGALWRRLSKVNRIVQRSKDNVD